MEQETGACSSKLNDSNEQLSMLRVELYQHIHTQRQLNADDRKEKEEREREHRDQLDLERSLSAQRPDLQDSEYEQRESEAAAFFGNLRDQMFEELTLLLDTRVAELRHDTDVGLVLMKNDTHRTLSNGLQSHFDTKMEEVKVLLNASVVRFINVCTYIYLYM